MSEAEKLKELKAKMARDPFRPFVVELLSGPWIVIDSNSNVQFSPQRPEVVIILTEGGMQHVFQVSMIASLIDT